MTWTSTLHRVATQTNELGNVTTYAYDSYGNPTSITDPGSNVWTFTYTSRGLVASSTTPDPDGAGSLTAATTSFSYDTYGRRTGQTNPDSTTNS